MEVAWGSKTARRYPVDITITAYQQTDLIHEVTAVFANEHVVIISMNASPNQKNNTTVLYLTVEVDGLHPLSRVLTRINQCSQLLV